MSRNHYHKIHASFLRQCALAAQELQEILQKPVQVLNLDGFTDEASWPEGAFLGMGEFRLLIDDVYQGSVAIVISLVEDTNLLVSSELAEALLDSWLPNSNFPVVDPRTGEEVGKVLIQSGVQVGPPLPSKTRPMLPLLLSFSTNLQSG